MANVTVIIQAEDVKLALRAVEESLGPQSLTSFVAGPIEQHLQSRAASRFASEGDSASGKWAPLRPTTEWIRESQGFPGAHPINRRTGALYNFVANGDVDVLASGAEGVKAMWPGTTGNSELENKFQVAQSGSDAADNPAHGSADTPPRPVAVIDETDVTQVLVALANWIELSMRSGGLM